MRLWPRVLKEFHHKRSRLLGKIPEDDPIRLGVDLLHPIRCASDETLHSQALAYALNPAEKHGFERSVVRALLQVIRDAYPRAGAARVLKRVQKSTAKITVTPEYRFRVEGMRNRSIARSDIWIEAKVRKHAAVIVIENKIGAGESTGQLGWYEQKVSAWCKAHGGRCLLIFLTKNGDVAKTSKKHRWVPLSYLELASALRKAWVQNRNKEGVHWLALYIASIARGVVGIRIEDPGSFTLADMQTYLARARA
jgi:hypothetical protein